MIRAFMLVTLVWLKSLSALAQTNAVVSAERMNVAYLGLHNPLKAVAEKTACKSLWLQTDNGKIERTGNCSFDFVPSEPGSATIYVCKVEGRDTVRLSSVRFRVKRLPDPEAAITHEGRLYLSGTIRVDSLKKQTRIRTYIEGFDFDVEGAYPISQFTVTVIGRNEHCNRITCMSAHFCEEIKRVLNNVVAGDIVLFTNIIAQRQGLSIQVQPLELFCQ